MRRAALTGKAMSPPSGMLHLPMSCCKTRAAEHPHPLPHYLGQNKAQQSQVSGGERGFRASQQEQTAREAPARGGATVRSHRSEAVLSSQGQSLPTRVKAEGLAQLR